ncbi:MAG TPA: hypothetical protein GX509_01980 [Firmicutes bacterium]|nr:hypothetical protein [Bacillota bacterium]
MRPIDIQNMVSRTHEVEKVQRISEDSSRLQQIAFATELLRLKARQSKQVKASEETEGGKVHTGDHQQRKVNGDGKQRHGTEGNPSYGAGRDQSHGAEGNHSHGTEWNHAEEGLDERQRGSSGQEGQDRSTGLVIDSRA